MTGRVLLQSAAAALVLLLAPACSGGTGRGAGPRADTTGGGRDPAATDGPAATSTPSGPGSNDDSDTIGPGRETGPASTALPTSLDFAAQPYSLPDGSILYFFESCATCSGAGGLYRLVQDDNGEWQREPLLVPEQEGFPRGWPVGPVVTDGGRRWATRWCLADPDGCGKTHDGRSALLVSEDGGASWTEVDRLEPMTTLLRFENENEEVLAVRTIWPEPRYEYALYPSRSPYPAPATPMLRPDRRGVPGVSVQVVEEQPTAGTPYLAVELLTVSVAGTPGLSRYHFAAGSLSPALVLSPALILGVATWDEKPGGRPAGWDYFRLPVAIDLEARTVAPIDGLQPLEDYSFVQPLLLLQPGEWAIVRADPCLNVRAGPSLSAAVLECAHNGALLPIRQAEDQPEGWTATATVDGRPGWVRSEYLAGKR